MVVLENQHVFVSVLSWRHVIKVEMQEFVRFDRVQGSSEGTRPNFAWSTAEAMDAGMHEFLDVFAHALPKEVGLDSGLRNTWTAMTADTKVCGDEDAGLEEVVVGGYPDDSGFVLEKASATDEILRRLLLRVLLRLRNVADTCKSSFGSLDGVTGAYIKALTAPPELS